MLVAADALVWGAMLSELPVFRVVERTRLAVDGAGADEGTENAVCSVDAALNGGDDGTADVLAC